jgi:hypothetical protein
LVDSFGEEGRGKREGGVVRRCYGHVYPELFIIVEDAVYLSLYIL